MFAGPNGSGKTTTIEKIRKNFNIGYFINADNIEALLKSQQYLDCLDFVPEPILPQELKKFLITYKMDERFRFSDFNGVTIKENFLTSSREISSYHAAVIAEFFREKLLSMKYTFSFETVMSHQSKVDFLQQAKLEGFVTYLYFICTQDPDINVQRVKNRVIKGGHDVEAGKIISRYYRSLELLSSAFLVADKAYVLDSSNMSGDVIIEKQYDEVLLHQENVPDWVAEYLLEKLDRR
jgi:predicted ABC-type ATPase